MRGLRTLNASSQFFSHFCHEIGELLEDQQNVWLFLAVSFASRWLPFYISLSAPFCMVGKEEWQLPVNWSCEKILVRESYPPLPMCVRTCERVCRNKLVPRSIAPARVIEGRKRGSQVSTGHLPVIGTINCPSESCNWCCIQLPTAGRGRRRSLYILAQPVLEKSTRQVWKRQFSGVGCSCWDPVAASSLLIQLDLCSWYIPPRWSAGANGWVRRGNGEGWCVWEGGQGICVDVPRKFWGAPSQVPPQFA